MAELMIRTARHTIRVAAQPKRVYQLIADVNRWPQIFDPTVSVEHLGYAGSGERVRVWELVGGDVHSYVSHRELNPVRTQVRFRQEGTPDPVASMGGLWLVLPKGNGALVTLDHYYRVVDDNPADAEWLAAAIDRNSRAMLAALRETAELDTELDALWLSCEDSVDIDGDARDVYDFLARAEDYPQRLAHVDRVLLAEEVFGIQHLETDIRTPDGAVHSTATVRVCFPETHIVYKQTRPPAIMRAHTGVFVVRGLPTGVRVTAQHTVLLRREAMTGPLGAEFGATQDARVAVREVLRAFSLGTLGRAKAFAEARRPVWASGPQR
ncbi:MAG TPA: aromatase/cyclase [Actinophytocola sp.]|uniref:aromatase/cyclase n=1 Tax=Actinophytocola sp. TaxID=1872138 RepID=UPI002DB682E6|nr:aromatase/cyclase [Actinophytocola sp.]HEU5469449.1 aromatase/cyclase [Actinophytocola sp.]